MTVRAIARSAWLGIAVLLAATACIEDSNSVGRIHATGGRISSGGRDAGVETSAGGDDGSGGAWGGQASGGAPTGGTAIAGSGTGGGVISVCAQVSDLPTMGTHCSTIGESQCTAAGRCVCGARLLWHCDTACASTYPTPPIPNSDCLPGAVCTYPGGLGCACLDGKWACNGGSNRDGGVCPPSSPPGQRCDELVGWFCDFPGAMHVMCLCVTNSVDLGGASWICALGARCPPAQPDYPTTCNGAAFCSYSSGTVLCSCPVSGSAWVCDWPPVISPPKPELPDSGS